MLPGPGSGRWSIVWKARPISSCPVLHTLVWIRSVGHQGRVRLKLGRQHANPEQQSLVARRSTSQTYEDMFQCIIVWRAGVTSLLSLENQAYPSGLDRKIFLPDTLLLVGRASGLTSSGLLGASSATIGAIHGVSAFLGTPGSPGCARCKPCTRHALSARLQEFAA